jgi:acyl-CoA reductase-like NAD-dependent aldehyde dehydrogenase
MLESLVAESVKGGAEILTVGERLDGHGFFYPPTILKNDGRDIHNIKNYGHNKTLGILGQS